VLTTSGSRHISIGPEDRTVLFGEVSGLSGKVSDRAFQPVKKPVKALVTDTDGGP